MPAKWQLWFPFRIDAFRGSPAVQAMSPAARAGYIYLLASCWQSDDCSIPDDDIKLAEMSGLIDSLWETHRERILRKFIQLENGKLTNEALQKDWLEAKRVFESRTSAAQKTNKERWANGDRSVTDRGPSRSAYTRTGTGTVTGTKTKAKTPPSAGANGGFMAAYALAQELGLAVGAYDVQMLGQVIEIAAEQAKIDVGEAVKMLAESARAAEKAGEVVNVFWFKDRKFLKGDKENGTNPSRTSQRVKANRIALAKAAERRGWVSFDGVDGKPDAPISEPGSGGVDRGVSGGFRETSPEILPPDGAGRH